MKEEEWKERQKEIKEFAEKAVKDGVSDLLDNELKITGRIGATMQNVQKDIIQFMGIFVAIFAVLGINMGNAGTLSPMKLLYVNVIVLTAVVTLVTLVSFIIRAEKKRTVPCSY